MVDLSGTQDYHRIESLRPLAVYKWPGDKMVMKGFDLWNNGGPYKHGASVTTAIHSDRIKRAPCAMTGTPADSWVSGDHTVLVYINRDMPSRVWAWFLEHAISAGAFSEEQTVVDVFEHKDVKVEGDALKFAIQVGRFEKICGSDAVENVFAFWRAKMKGMLTDA